MSDTIINLDDGIVENFKFSIKGYTYNFKLPNTEEIDELVSFGKDSKKIREWLFKFVTKINEKDPDIAEVINKSSLQYFMAFQDMVIKKLNINGDNKG
jgi:hypothetical protein